ncbi:undecaprenyl-phosphate alpha-N-acetylglucosaminyl 1-phosphate transferase [Aliidiomarina indica]|uniref:undecaprenyl-phosphate alpha-N-acetylglucosaminyl 1-phosphate transferase n=1 Tax=Aliidiomarina indica TaxID=2749147 RepID=UPI00188E40B5|nr:undecaprenyl-phosphate alpha-N-acetylglucosaminyl 1-phosphate transferase [Aliidiomarina indica]
MEFVVVLLSTLAVTWLLQALLVPLAAKYGLVDKPCSRKQHSGEIPLIGGLALALTFFLVASIIFEINFQFVCVIVSSVLMVTTGVLDDRFDLSVRLRIVMQLIAASILVFGAGIQITTLGNLFGFGVIDLGDWAAPFTVLAIMTAMNAYNMIDGIDGLLGGLSIVSMIGIAALAILHQQTTPFFFSLILLSALLPFLHRNLQKNGTRIKKVFMGDAGSMFIGLVVVWLLALLTNPELSNKYVLQYGESYFGGASESKVRPVAVLWLIAIPLMDMLGIMVRRVVKGQNPFKPDRDHLHHIFMRAGFTPREALTVITLSAIWWMFVGLYLEYLQVPEVIVLAAYFCVFGIYLLCLKYCWRISALVRKVRKVETKQSVR